MNIFICSRYRFRSQSYVLLAVAGLAGLSSADPLKGLEPCPSSPNCVVSMLDQTQAHQDGTTPDWYVKPIALDFAQTEQLSEAQVMDRLVEVLKQMGLQSIQVKGREVHGISKSSVFGFKDDLKAQVRPDLGVIHVRSASRTGYYDFGQNRKRVERLRQLLR